MKKTITVLLVLIIIACKKEDAKPDPVCHRVEYNVVDSATNTPLSGVYSNKCDADLTAAQNYGVQYKHDTIHYGDFNEHLSETQKTYYTFP